MHERSREIVASLVVGLVALITASEHASAQMTAGEPKLPPNLAAVRNALAKYQDPLAAIRDGYFSTLGCVDFPKGSAGPGMMSYKPGGMGVHFRNPGLISPKLDSLKPQILLLHHVVPAWPVHVSRGIHEDGHAVGALPQIITAMS